MSAVLLTNVLYHIEGCLLEIKILFRFKTIPKSLEQTNVLGRYFFMRIPFKLIASNENSNNLKGQPCRPTSDYDNNTSSRHPKITLHPLRSFAIETRLY